MELTEYQKTLRELYLTNGLPGLYQYLEKHEGLSYEDATTKIDEFLSALGTPKDEVTDTFTAGPSSVETMTVTFADGSQKEIEVAPA